MICRRGQRSCSRTFIYAMDALFAADSNARVIKLLEIGRYGVTRFVGGSLEYVIALVTATATATKG